MVGRSLFRGPHSTLRRAPSHRTKEHPGGTYDSDDENPLVVNPVEAVGALAGLTILKIHPTSRHTVSGVAQNMFYLTVQFWSDTSVIELSGTQKARYICVRKAHAVLSC